MNLKNWLKNNPVLRNWKFTAAYFLIAAGGSTVAQFTYESPVKEYPGVLLAAVFLIFYICFAAAVRLSVNYTINNHRKTTGIFASCLAMFSLTTVGVLGFHIENWYGAAMIVPLYLFIVSVAAIVIRKKEKARIPMYIFSLIALSIGGFFYLLISYLMYSYGGITLVILGAGILLALIFGIFGALSKAPAADTENLKKRFDAYLDDVFKRVPFTEENLALREQLHDNLVKYAEEAKEGQSEDKVYRDAVDSLGDYSQFIRKYKKNPIARFAKTSNLFADIWVFFVVEFTLTMFAGFGLPDKNWNEIFIILILFPLMGFAVLMFVRVVNNFRTKDHRLTSIILGIALTAALFVIAIFNGIDDNSSELSKKILNTMVFIPLGGSIIAEILVRIIGKYGRKNKKVS